MAKRFPMIIFPYGGYKNGDKRQDNFHKLVDICREELRPEMIYVILSSDTFEKKLHRQFYDDFNLPESNPAKHEDITALRMWSVDTCQRWLAGWGHVIDNDEPEDDARIVQIAGDIDKYIDLGKDWQNLRDFVKADKGHADLVIGDYKTSSKFTSKELIDTYGTFPLVSTWFPELPQAIEELEIQKPRSEFINIKVRTLKDLITNSQPFAYEQTLNMLIHLFDFGFHRGWKSKIERIDLGTIEDDKSYRSYRECIDQIERTERMLKFVWRKMYEPDPAVDTDRYIKFIDRYELYDKRSTAIREAAMVTIRRLLK